MTDAPMDEEALAAYALAGILASTMMKAYEEGRTFLYCWERDGLSWLIRFRDRNPHGVFNDWTGTFIRLNREAILTGGRMDFNLKAFSELSAA